MRSGTPYLRTWAARRRATTAASSPIAVDPLKGIADIMGNMMRQQIKLWQAGPEIVSSMTNAFLAQRANPESRERPEWLEAHTPPFSNVGGCVVDDEGEMFCEGMTAQEAAWVATCLNKACGVTAKGDAK